MLQTSKSINDQTTLGSTTTISIHRCTFATRRSRIVVRSTHHALQRIPLLSDSQAPP
ncbi:hypothetical protein BAUCODRAFT_130160, partial [Baudoinia panamericana UAMH 10762]